MIFTRCSDTHAEVVSKLLADIADAHAEEEVASKQLVNTADEACARVVLGCLPILVLLSWGKTTELKKLCFLDVHVSAVWKSRFSTGLAYQTLPTVVYHHIAAREACYQACPERDDERIRDDSDYPLEDELYDRAKAEPQKFASNDCSHPGVDDGV